MSELNEIPDKLIMNIPQLLTENYTEDFKSLDYKGDPKDIKERMKHKLFCIWGMWDRFSKDELLAKAMNEVPDDRQSDEFKMKQVLLFTYEELAYILKSTDIIEEILDGCNLDELMNAVKPEQ
jgi:hypothetical protein